MPYYLFKCPQCSDKSEISLKVSERNDPRKCEKCGWEPLNRQPTTASMKFIGSGFYSNDY